MIFAADKNILKLNYYLNKFFIILTLILLVGCSTNIKQDENSTQTLKPIPKKKNSSEAYYDKYDKYNKYNNYKKQDKDRFEIFNRKMFFLNEKIDIYIISNVIKGYQAVTNKPIRYSVNNFFTNLKTPLYAINSTLQGNGKQAVNNISSFAINSTTGVLGLFNVAKKWDINRKPEDFGQTLARYNVPSGPYLFLPILGPGSLRDTPSRIVDNVINPITNSREKGLLDSSEKVYPAVKMGTALTTRERLQGTLEEIRKSSFDTYSTVKSAYIQKRKKDIKDRQ